MAAVEIALGNGHWLRFASWSPDRELNPQYADLPDVEKCTALIRHDLRPDDDQAFCRERDYCEGAANLESAVTRRIFPESALWQVESWEPLSLSPSILCHCGDHGFIRGGRWVSA